MAAETDLVAALDAELRKCQRRVRRDDAYYEGEQPLRYMAPQLELEVGQRIAQLVINWPALCADAYADRLDIEGFQYPDDESADDDLWSWWEMNDGEQQSQLAHLEALIHGRSYVIVGAGESPSDPAIFTVEHPAQVVVRHDPRTRAVSSALKRWVDDDGAPRATLYLPESTVQYARGKARGTVWAEVDRDDHRVGTVPVVQLTNRGRMLRTGGKSEFDSVIPIADAANKMATDMMISGEFHAMPRRWVVGMTEDDFVDETGKPLGSWSAIAGRLWSTDNVDVKMGQFAESDLAVFHNTIKVLAQLAAQLMFLPQDYMSFTSDNPTSADAMRSAESRMIKRVERKHTPFGGGWEQVHRLRILFEGGEIDERAKRLKTLWRDPSTPTVAQKADAAVKLHAAGIIPLEQTRADLGYSPEQRRRMAEQDAVEADRSLLGTLSDQIRATPALNDAVA